MKRPTRKKNTSADERRLKELYYFDAAAADRACQFFPRFLKHLKGDLAKHPFALLPWQKERIVRPLFGWKRKADDKRRYSTAYVEIPRKNGKSTLAAGIALLLLFADGEAGAEIYSAAGDRQQASIVFDIARQMRDRSPALARRSTAVKTGIAVPATASFYRPLTSEAYNKWGYNAHGIIFDELHAQPNRELWDALTTSVAGRSQPITFAITTAGFDRESICWKLHHYACQVRDGIVPDDTFLPVLFGADPEDDWTSPATWKKANPGYGVSVKPHYLAQKCREAQEAPAAENTFRQLHLNQWTAQQTRWIPMHRWQACALPVDPQQLRGRLSFGGLDLASITDIAALALLFPPLEGERYEALLKFWVPAEGARERGRRDGVDYTTWIKQGLITATPGATIDYAFIRRDINQLGKLYRIKEIAFDRWGAALLRTELEGDGFTMIDTGQGFASLSAPSKELEKLILSEQLAHGDNPVLNWMADNVEIKRDAAENIKPDKSATTARIDGIQALIMAVDRAMRQKTPSGPYLVF